MMTEYPCAWCQAEDANKTMNVIGNSSWYVSADASYFVFKVNLFRFCQINIICTDVAVCDPVYNMETVFEPRCEKTGLRGFRPGPTQTRLYSHRRWLEA